MKKELNKHAEKNPTSFMSGSVKQTLKWINDKLTPIKWHYKMMMVILAGVIARLIVLFLR